MDNRTKRQELNRLLDIVERCQTLKEQYQRNAFQATTKEEKARSLQCAEHWESERLQTREAIMRLVGLPKLAIVPGKAGTVAAEELTVFQMGDGEGKPIQAINPEGTLILYVGIGWVEQRPAIQADADNYPLIIARTE